MPAPIPCEVRARPRAALRSRRPWEQRLAVSLAALVLTAVTGVTGSMGVTGAQAGPSSALPLSTPAPISTRTMLSRLEQPWVQLIDVRTPDEFSGRDIRALRGGHIPGAINIPIHDDAHLDSGIAVPASPADRAATVDHASTADRTVQPDRASLTDRFCEDARLVGLDVRKETIVYGRDAQQARQAAERLRELGFRDLRVYLDAWQVWGNTLELPVAGERFADVAALRAQLDELQHRVAQLTRRAAATSMTVGASPGSLAPAPEQLASSTQPPQRRQTLTSR